MPEARSINYGSASHMGEDQLPCDSHFIFDYMRRRVPMPILSYMAVADSVKEHPGGDVAAKRVLDMLRDLVEPAVIAEEELSRPHMEKLIRESLSEINEQLFKLSQAEKDPQTMQASVTVVMADAGRAYIGHVGTNRVYLVHGDRLYDLTPTGELSADAKPAPDTMQLFDVPGEGDQPQQPEPPVASGPPGAYMGQAPEAIVGYNDVEISFDDTLVLASDGLWSVVTEDEMVENLLSAMSVQRSCSQLTRLAFTRQSKDNATMVAWQYVVPGEAPAADERVRRTRERRGTAVEAMLMALLILVLCGIFAVGFAFGWRITDTFRKPAKEKARKEALKHTVPTTQPQPEKSTPESTAPEESSPAGSQPGARGQVATINGQGVRMRESANPTAKIVGLFTDGQQVTVLGETMGTDSKTWSHVSGKVKSAGKEIEAQGFVRNDFLVKGSTSSSPSASSTAP